MDKRTCSVEDCTKERKRRGWCDMHYWRWKKYGDPLVTTRIQSNRGAPCGIDGCGKPVRTREWCSTHYWRWQAYGDPLGGPPIEPCAWPGGCDKPVWVTKSRSKMCDYHATRTWKKANPKVINEANRRYARQHPDKVSAWSKKWRDANPDKNAEYRTTRQARVLGQFVERVYRSVVFRRDKGICGICHKKVDPENWHLDHIIPLSRGGEHSYANVQVSHPFCNVSKGAKLIEHQLCLL
jgi:5-methylcytosine-specific restriction endonuclease McrA